MPDARDRTRDRAVLLAAVIAAVACSLAVAVPGVWASPRLVPEPHHVVVGTGHLAVLPGTTIAVPADPEDRFAAGVLADEIESTCGVKPAIVEGERGTIVLVRDARAADLGEEGYRLEVTAGGAHASARTAAGLFYAVQTLRQLVEPAGVACVSIEDRPALRWRGVHDDVSRGPMPTLATLERRIRTAAGFKCNLYVLYLETAFAYRAHPLLAGAGGGLDSAEVRELAGFARRYHVELVPEQQTTAHLEKVLRFERYQGLAELPHGSTLAPGPETDAFVGSLLDELAEAFPGPFVHLGGDEPAELGQGRSRPQVGARGVAGVFLEHAQHLDALARAHGRQLMLWGDVAVDHPEIARSLPADVVVTSWCYEPHDDYARWIRPFADAHLTWLACPGAANWNRVFPNLDVALPNVRGFVSQARSAGAAGALTCVWADNGDAPFDLNWYALAAGAAAAWQQADLDTLRFRAAFDWAFLRSDGTALADAIASLQSVHRLVEQSRRYDASLDTFWQHPLGSALDNATDALLAPASARVCALAEDALADLARARDAARQNREALDAFAFAARRLHAIGMRARVAGSVAAQYRQLLAAVSARQGPEVTRLLDQVDAEITEGRETAVALRAEQETLWRRENRPEWLGNLLARYDRDTQRWVECGEAWHRYLLALRLARPVPGPEELGVAP